MEAWRNTILSAGSRDDTILERRRFNHTLTLLRAGARLQCMCMTAKGLQCKNKAREGGIFCGRHTTCKVTMEAMPMKKEEVAQVKQCTRRKGRCQVMRKGEAVDETCEFNTNTGRCKNRKATQKEKQAMYTPEATHLNDEKQKWCRCVLHVAKKNSTACLKNKSWDDDKCYNPYAVCGKSVKTSTGGKPCGYDFDNIQEDEVHAYLYMNFDKFNTWAMEKGHPDLENIKVKEMKKYAKMFYGRKKPAKKKTAEPKKKPAKTIEPKKKPAKKKEPKRKSTPGSCFVDKANRLPAGFKPMLAESLGTVRDGKLLKKEKIDVRGYYASEKFDGYRAIWDGEKFISRTRNTFEVPSWFKDLMPSEPLDGELFRGRCNYESCGIFRRAEATEADWMNVNYMVFDLPAMNNATFEERMERLEAIVADRCGCMVDVATPKGIVEVGCPLVFAEQTLVRTEQDAIKMFEDITAKGGEGIMLRKPGSKYSNRRTKDLLKLKVEDDMECKIVGYKDGTGKYAGMLGSYKCALLDDASKTFFVGSGLTDMDRENRLPVGTIITITYNDKTKNGIPRHPRFLRVRADDK